MRFTFKTKQGNKKKVACLECFKREWNAKMHEPRCCEGWLLMKKKMKLGVCASKIEIIWREKWTYSVSGGHLEFSGT